MGNDNLKLTNSDAWEIILRAMIDINPNYAEMHNDLGNLLLWHHEVDEGVKEIRKAIEINPNLIEAYQSLAGGLHLEGRYKEEDQERKKVREMSANLRQHQHEVPMYDGSIEAIQRRIGYYEEWESKFIDEDLFTQLIEKQAKIKLLKKRKEQTNEKNHNTSKSPFLAYILAPIFGMLLGYKIINTILMRIMNFWVNPVAGLVNKLSETKKPDKEKEKILKRPPPQEILERLPSQKIQSSIDKNIPHSSQLPRNEFEQLLNEVISKMRNSE